jgi:hypothetical protein
VTEVVKVTLIPELAAQVQLPEGIEIISPSAGLAFSELIADCTLLSLQEAAVYVVARPGLQKKAAATTANRSNLMVLVIDAISLTENERPRNSWATRRQLADS